MKSKLIFLLILLLSLSGCAKSPAGLPDKAEEIDGLKFAERVETSFANQFAIDRYEGGYSMISTSDGERYLIVPKGGETPEKIDDKIKVIRRPTEKIYMAATAAMEHFAALGKTDAVSFSALSGDKWYIEAAREALESGGMIYAGKYNLPDYELLLSKGCPLSIQSTMISHAPEVKEKLEELGITVFTDLSSYESHPLGRSEWIKVYGEILGESDLAKELFEEQTSRLEKLPEITGEKKKAVFFYISGSGGIITRKSGDYVSKMIELAGGENVLSEKGGDNALSTVAMEPEEFYTKARDADVIIYDGAITGEINSFSELTEKNALLADFKAVKNKNVWCTKKSFFQETLETGEIISEFNSVFSQDAEDELKHLRRLKDGD